MHFFRYLSGLAWHCQRSLVVKVKGQLLRLKYPDMQVGRQTMFRFDTLGALQFGSNVNIGPFCEIVAYRRHGLTPVPGSLTLGNRTVIAAFASIRASGGAIEIGSDSMIGQHVSLAAANHGVKAGAVYASLPFEQRRTGIRIGSNVWLGAGVAVLPGISIGDNSIVGAGAVVTRDIPANEVWAGIPAKKVGSIPL